MEIKQIFNNKKQFLNLLLLADEQENMIDKYLERGDMFALYDDDLKSICVVTEEDTGIYELKNLATYEKYQGQMISLPGLNSSTKTKYLRQGYATRLVQYIFEYYKNKCKTMYVGTGDSPTTIPFYQHCGFTLSHRIENFFIENYNKPIFEQGIQLVDMVYLKKDF